MAWKSHWQPLLCFCFGRFSRISAIFATKYCVLWYFVLFHSNAELQNWRQRINVHFWHSCRANSVWTRKRWTIQSIYVGKATWSRMGWIIVNARNYRNIQWRFGKSQAFSNTYYTPSFQAFLWPRLFSDCQWWWVPLSWLSRWSWPLQQSKKTV